MRSVADIYHTREISPECCDKRPLDVESWRDDTHPETELLVYIDNRLPYCKIKKIDDILSLTVGIYSQL